MCKRCFWSISMFKVVVWVAYCLRTGLPYETGSGQLEGAIFCVGLLCRQRAGYNYLPDSYLDGDCCVVVFSWGMQGRFLLCQRKVLMSRFFSYSACLQEGTGLFGYLRWVSMCLCVQTRVCMGLIRAGSFSCDVIYFLFGFTCLWECVAIVDTLRHGLERVLFGSFRFLVFLPIIFLLC